MLLADIQRWREHARPVKWGVGCAGIYLGAWWVWDLPFPARANELLSAAVSVSAISIGFIATAMSILASSGASPYIQKLREKNSYNHYVRRLQGAVFYSVGLLVLSLLALFLPRPEASPDPQAWGYAVGVAVWISAFGAAIAAYLHVVSSMTRTLEEPSGLPTPAVKATPAPDPAPEATPAPAPEATPAPTPTPAPEPTPTPNPQ